MWVESSQGVVLAVHELSSSDRPSVPARLNAATETERLDFRPTIIFCHATGLHAHTWLPVAQELEDDFRCVALDFRGHGYTKTPEGISFSWAEMTQDLLAVVTALRQVSQRGDSTSPSPGSASSPPVPLLAVGHSMGGAAIVHAQRAMPGLFEKAWLFEPILPIPSASLPVAIAVSGDDSRPAAFSRRTAQAIPQAELLSFSNLGHFGPQEDPTQIATSIREWFG